MKEVKLTLPEPPSSNRYWRVFRGRAVRSVEAEDYIGVVMGVYLTMRGATVAFPTGLVSLTVEWHRAKKMGDLDNRLKVVCDALRGLAYKDDKQVAEIHAVRYDAPKAGKLLVTVTRYDHT